MSFADAGIELKCAVLAGEYAYIQVPAQAWRGFFDGLFPSLSVNKIADSASGWMHRWREGHDLLLDVPATIKQHGFTEGLKHMGHITLTDFPTKAGIPIPGLSQNGLGEFLVNQCGIHKGYLNVSLMDGMVSIFVVAEGHADLLQAVFGDLQMTPSVFFDTIGEGVLELTLGILAPPSVLKASLIVGGLENIAAGVISTWNTITCYVDPLEFFGGFLLSAFIGGTLTFLLQHNKPSPELAKSVLTMALRSGLVGSLGAVSIFFGFGAILGLSAYALGKCLAAIDSKTGWEASSHATDLIIEETEKSFPGLAKALNDGSRFVVDALDMEKAIDFDSLTQPVCQGEVEPIVEYLDSSNDLSGFLNAVNASIEACFPEDIDFSSLLSEQERAVLKCLDQEYPGLATFLQSANLNVADLCGGGYVSIDELQAILEGEQLVFDERWSVITNHFQKLNDAQA